MKQDFYAELLAENMQRATGRRTDKSHGVIMNKELATAVIRMLRRAHVTGHGRAASCKEWRGYWSWIN